MDARKVPTLPLPRGGACPNGSAQRGGSARAGSTRYSSNRGSQPRRGASLGCRAAGRNTLWEGQRFFVQVERCGGLTARSVSVRYDDTKYVQHTNELQEEVELFFAKQLPVVAVDVQVPYAMEVRVMPFDFHPDQGQRCVMDAAEASGGRTIHSKMQSKKWPRPEMIIQSLVEFCRVPVRIRLVMRSPSGQGRHAGGATDAADGGDDALPLLREDMFANLGASGHPTEPVGLAQLFCTHAASGTITPSTPVITDKDGRVEMSLFPGSFTLNCEEDSKYDRVSPNVIIVPARFETLDVTITATVKKPCTFLVVDQHDRPFEQFALHVQSDADGRRRARTLSLQTKIDGKTKCRLGSGSYSISGQPPADGDPMTADPFSVVVEVDETDSPQIFRITVFRLLFPMEILLSTRFGATPVNVPFECRTEPGELVATGSSTSIGLVRIVAAPGRYNLRLRPTESSPFVSRQALIVMKDDGSCAPTHLQLDTKSTDVRIMLVTPDGQPAPDCLFHLSPQFTADADLDAQQDNQQPGVELPFRSDVGGLAVANMALLEPYWFRVKSSGSVMEYMPQEFSFQTDRRNFTAVVARSVFGRMPEEKVAVMVDASGSMQAYAEDVKVALNLALVQQFARSKKLFTIGAFSDDRLFFHPDLVSCTSRNVEDAMKFTASIQPGGGSDIAAALTSAFELKDLEAIYVVTDGKCSVGEALLNKVRSLYFAHRKRPRLHTIGINCVPHRSTWRALSAIALLTKGVFRPVCLQQEASDPISAALARAAEGAGLPRLACPDEENDDDGFGESGAENSVDESFA